jgi:hypothetical protein
MHRVWRVLGAVVLVALLGGAPPVAAQGAGGGWTAGPGATGDNTYVGSIDTPTNGSTIGPGTSVLVGGWIVDKQAQGWAGIDGLTVLDGTNQVATGIVGQNRPDVAAALGNPYYATSGFSALVPASALAAGPNTLTVAAHTPSKGTWTKQVTINVGGQPAPQPTGLVARILVPTENELILPTNLYTIRGTAYDTRTRPELGVGVDRVQVYLDGKRGTAGSHFLGEARPADDTTWSLDFAPTNWDSFRHHNMYVYFRSTVTGEELLVQRQFDIGAH